MIRKIVAQGKGANTLTLPAEWIKLNNLKPGDDVEIIKKDNDLIITTAKKEEAPVRSVEINAKGNKILLIALISAYYRKGYDEIHVVLNNKEEQVVKDKVSKMIGYEIMESKNDKLIIKRVASASMEEYNSSVRRSCFSLKTMSRTLLEGLRSNDKKMLGEILEMDANIDKLTDYGRHILLKDSSVDPSNAPNSYLFLWTVEKIGDLLRDVAKIYLNKKVVVSKEILSFHEETDELLSEFYDLAFDFDKIRFQKFCEKKDRLKVKIDAILSKSSKEKAFHAFYLASIVRFIHDSIGQIVMKNI